jgi:Ca-activated chloride channel family protein
MRKVPVRPARALSAILVGVFALVGANRGGRATTKAATAPPATTEGRLATREGKRVVDVPLEHTEVAIRATGHLAEVTVEQTFKNPYDKKIEAVYLFPLPTGAAVNGLEMQVGDRVIKGEIAKRDAAKATYVKAKKAGFVAALLTQERPNLFTQNVANLEPGARVVVRMTYLEPLVYKDGGYEIVFPMVAGPRYLPKTAAQANDADDADDAGDAATVQPAALPPDTRSSHDISLTVELDAGVPLRGVSSPSHVLAQTPGATAAQMTVALAPGDTIPNKDFVLRYDTAGGVTAAAVLAHRATAGDQPGAFFLTLQPPADATAADVAPREVVFVLDTSSSMKGAPLAKARALVRSILETLAPDDTFQIVRFADAASALGSSPIANKPKNVEYSLAWLDALTAAGGTEMTEGIAAALDLPHDPARLRLVVFLTDGYVGNEDEILATVHAKLGASRLYSFGVGSAVNRYLLEEMASFGRGVAQIVRPDEDTAAAVATFHARIARAVLTDVTVDWGALAVADVTPTAIPDLFVGQPIVLAGHYTAPGAGSVTIRGKAAGRDVTLAVPVDLPAANERPAIAAVWARARIAELGRAEIRGATDATRDEITRLALEHHLMSRYTAFVAVDRSHATTGGDATKVAVPVEVPDGLHATSGGGWGGGTSAGYASSGYGAGYGASYSAPMEVERMAEMDHAEPYHMALELEAPVAITVPAHEVRDDAAATPTTKPADTVDVSVYDKAAKAKVGDLRKLYAKRLKARPDLHGLFKLRIVIAPDGTVKNASVTSRPDGADAEELAAEMSNAAKQWSFDAPKDAVSVDLPIVFSPAEK